MGFNSGLKGENKLGRRWEYSVNILWLKEISIVRK
jgi:hypothetical protein